VAEVFLKKPTVVHRAKKYPVFYETWKITFFTKTRRGSYSEPTEYSPHSHALYLDTFQYEVWFTLWGRTPSGLDQDKFWQEHSHCRSGHGQAKDTFWQEH
jgi:hypothetical protein